MREAHVPDQEEPPPSYIAAPLPPDSPVPSLTDVQQRLADTLPVVGSRIVEMPEVPDAHWAMEVDVQFDPTQPQTHARVWSARSGSLEHLHSEHGGVPRQLLSSVDKSVMIGVGVPLGVHPQQEFHRQLQVLLAAAPDAVLLHDVSGLRVLPIEWLRAAVASKVAPGLSALYVIHAVKEESDQGKTCWMHTHGLLRCGMTELEILDVPTASQGLLGELLNSTASWLLDHGPFPPDRPFSVGAGIELVWLPWQEGIRKVRRGAGGTAKDRVSDHTDSSGLLFAPRRGLFGRGYATLDTYLTRLERNPLLYISTEETARMTALAEERLPTVLQLKAQHPGEPNWKFMVKLAYPIDGRQSDDEREHLWFEVHETDGQEADATLLNEPYGVSRLHEGDRGWHPLADMSDWTIISPHGYFTPDSLPLLEATLNQSGA